MLIRHVNTTPRHSCDPGNEQLQKWNTPRVDSLQLCALELVKAPQLHALEPVALWWLQLGIQRTALGCQQGQKASPVLMLVAELP